MAENVLERMSRIGADRKIADFKVKQKENYEFKVNYARIRAWEFYNECAKRDLNVHVSVGGLDSITLLLFLRSIGIDAPGISVSYLEDKSIMAVHKKLGVVSLKPCPFCGREMKFHKDSFVNKYGQTVVHQYYQHEDTEQDCVLDEICMPFTIPAGDANEEIGYIGWCAEKWNKRVEDGESK